MVSDGQTVQVHYTGKLDEVRVAATARSAEWLKASYNSQAENCSADSCLLSYRVEEISGEPTATITNTGTVTQPPSATPTPVCVATPSGMVAWWAGDGAAASHDTALAIYGLADAMPAVIHITVPRPFRGRRQGVTVHTAPLGDDERATRNGVPVTRPGRTIRDLAVRYGPEQAARVASEAIAQGLVTRTRLVRDLSADDATYPVLERLGLAR